MRGIRRHVPVLILAVVLLGAVIAPASAEKSFGERFDIQVNRKLSKPGIINEPGNPLHWTQLKGVPPVFADGADNGLTDINDCPEGSAIRVIHGDATVECISTASGDITGVTAGDGLTGGGDTGAVELDVDFTETQERIASTCTSGKAITAVAQDGTVTCASSGPIAAGRVLATGSAGAVGTGNWTSAFVTDHYEVTITGVSYNFNNHAAFITPMSCTGVDAVTYRAEAVPTANKLNVFFYKAVDQSTAQCMFQFQVIAY